MHVFPILAAEDISPSARCQTPRHWVIERRTDAGKPWPADADPDEEEVAHLPWAFDAKE
jgi:hypothetical protein